MDLNDLGAQLFGKTRLEGAAKLSTTHTITGVAQTDSDSGRVRVVISDDVTSSEDGDGTSQTLEQMTGDTTVELDTEVAVKAGDVVTITTVGGELKTPTVTGVVGGGDRMQSAIDDASEDASAAITAAEEAKMIAEATDQHFWEDSSGIHVTEVSQEDWNDPTSPDYHAGANQLSNSQGIIIRDGETNIAAFSQSAVSFFDGNGNAAENIVASFGVSGAQIGDASSASITISSDGIRFMGKNGAIAGLIDSGALQTVGMNIGLVGADTEAEFAAGNASTQNIRYEEPDFGLGDLVATVEFEVGGVSTTEVHSFSAYGTHADTYTTVTVTAPSGSDPWSVTLTPSASGMTLTRFRGHYYISTSAPRVAFGNGEATGSFAFAAGEQAKSTNRAAFASGVYSEANGFASIASGTNVIANGASQAVFGKNNVADSVSLLIVGNGANQNARSNALTLDGSGNLALAGSVSGATLSSIGNASVGGDLSVSGALTLPVISTSTANEIATAGTGFTVTGASYTQWGAIATLYVTVRNTNALTAGTLYNPIATLVSGKRPLQYAPASLGTGASIYGNAQLNTNGNIGFRPSVAVAANSTITIRATYIVA